MVNIFAGANLVKIMIIFAKIYRTVMAEKNIWIIFIKQKIC